MLDHGRSLEKHNIAQIYAIMITQIPNCVNGARTLVLPHDQLQFVNNFKIITMNEISSILKKYVTDKCKLPDHSILYFNVRMSYNINAMHGGGQQDMQHVQNCENIFIKKYTFDVIPKEFMNNQQWNNKLLHFYDTLNAHDDINISYANLLDIVC